MTAYSRMSGVFLFICLAVWMSPTAASADEVRCNTTLAEFFDKADASDVTRCLESTIRARYDGGQTHLHFAAQLGRKSGVIHALLMLGAKVNARDKSGRTPLHYAVSSLVWRPQPPIVEALVQAGADLSARDDEGRTPLHVAVGGDGYTGPDLAPVKILLRARADVNARAKDGRTPLHIAAGGRSPLRNATNPAVVMALLEAGADVNARNNIGLTPLDRATTKTRAVLRKAMVAATKKAEARAAARKQQIEDRLRAKQVSCEKWNTFGFFRNAGAADVSRCLKTENLSARNRYGETPLHMVAKFGEASAVVAAIVKAGADLNARDERGRTPLHTAAVFSKKPEVVTALIKAGADLTAKDKEGRTPVQYAEKFSKTPAVVAVLRKSAVPKQTTVATQKQDVERRPASTQVSCEKWNTPSFFRDANLSDLTRCLKTKDPNAHSGNGRTPLHYAAQGQAPALVTALAKAGADVNARDDRGGWTPLHLAAWFSKTPSVVDALLAAGADTTARDKAGKTPWNYAEQNAALKDTAPYRRLNEERFR